MSEAVSTPPSALVLAEIAEHFAGYNDKTLKRANRFEWLAHKGWLQDHGLIPDDRPKPREIVNATAVDTVAIGSPPNLRMVGGPKGQPPRERLIRLRWATDVTREEVRWLWPDRIPYDTLSMLVGIPGDGKSSLALEMAAIVSRGGYWPDAAEDDPPCEPGLVLILQAEMHVNTIVMKRLEESGADLSRVVFLETVEDSEGLPSPFSLSVDLPRLQQEVEKLKDVRGGVKLVIIDPIASYLHGTDENKNSEVRELTDPLVKFAEQNQIALVIVAHLNKGMSTNILGRISGSVAFGAVARMVWYVSRHPTDRSRRVLSFVKGNLTDGDPKGLAYGYRNGRHEWDPEPLDWCADDVAKQLVERSVVGDDDEPKKRGRPSRATAAARQLIEEHTKLGAVSRAKVMAIAIGRGLKRTTFLGAVDKLRAEGKIETPKVDGDMLLEWTGPQRLKLANPDADADMASEDLTDAKPDVIPGPGTSAPEIQPGPLQGVPEIHHPANFRRWKSLSLSMFQRRKFPTGLPACAGARVRGKALPEFLALEVVVPQYLSAPEIP